MTDKPLFLRALAGEDTPTAPMWFMRQAGRYLPEYMAIKAKHPFWEMVREPELATEVTLQPLRRYGLDAAILFSDIMTPLVAMGVDIEFTPGPVIRAPLRTEADVAATRVPEKDEIAPYVGDAIRMIRRATDTPLIGFGGAPLTLATYLVEGGGSKDFATFRGWLRAEPRAAHALLGKLTEVSIRYLTMQVEAGAQAIQLFDSWAGLHATRAYDTFAAPYNQRIFEALGRLGVPRIYLAVDASHLWGSITRYDCEGVSVDWRNPVDQARRAMPGKVIQGNLDPSALLGSRDELLTEARAVLEAGVGGPHIFNLGHGMLRQTPPERVAELVAYVRGWDRRASMAGERAGAAMEPR